MIYPHNGENHSDPVIRIDHYRLCWPPFTISSKTMWKISILIALNQPRFPFSFSISNSVLFDSNELCSSNGYCGGEYNESMKENVNFILFGNKDTRVKELRSRRVLRLRSVNITCMSSTTITTILAISG